VPWKLNFFKVISQSSVCEVLLEVFHILLDRVGSISATICWKARSMSLPSLMAILEGGQNRGYTAEVLPQKTGDKAAGLHPSCDI
jgi:hypothetical protein